MSRIVPLAQITAGPLPWTIRRANGPSTSDQFPAFLTVFAPMLLAQKHAAVMLARETLQLQWVGLHYTAVSIDRD